MGKNLGKKQVIAVIRDILGRIDKGKKFKTNIDRITEETDIRELDMDSLETMEYLFAIDETFGKEISNDVFQGKELAVIGNLVAYLIESSQNT